MKRIIWTFGILGGLISAAGFFIGVLSGTNGEPDFDNMELYGWIFIFLAFVPLILGMRKAFNDGHAFSFGKQFRTGILITCLISAIYSLSFVVYMQTDAGSQFMDQMFQHYSQQMNSDPNLSPEELQQGKEQMNSMKQIYSNPFMAFLMTFLIEPFPPGLVLTLISALFWGRKGRPYRMHNPA